MSLCADVAVLWFETDVLAVPLASAPTSDADKVISEESAFPFIFLEVETLPDNAELTTLFWTGFVDEDDNASSTVNGHADRLTALESKVGDGFTAVTNAEIDAWFE